MDRTRRTLVGGACALTLLGAAPRVPAFQWTGRIISPRAFGALGDGLADDTDAFQRAIDSLGGQGGTVAVPAGRYRLDPLRSVMLRDRVHLQLDPAATLVAIPNAADRAVLLMVREVSDVVISGGSIVGERDQHFGTTGEWGHGIQLRGARRVTLRDLHVSRCWGDGLSVAGTERVHGAPSEASTDVLLQRVVSTGNRRQGLTIGYAHRVRVIDCEFAGTEGTPPAAGIDVEPDASLATAIEIAHCRIHDNRGPGIQVWKRAQGVQIHDCALDNNRYGVLVLGCDDTRLERNTIRGNGQFGVLVRGEATRVVVRENRFADNGKSLRAFLEAPILPATARHLRIEGDAADVKASDNRFD